MRKDNPYYQEKTITQDKFNDFANIISDMSKETHEKIKADNFDARNYQLMVTKLVETAQFITIAMYLEKHTDPTESAQGTK